MITGGTIHSEMRKRDIERSCEAFGGSTGDPQSPVEAVESSVMTATLRPRRDNSER
jgi:hypothetical protein